MASESPLDLSLNAAPLPTPPGVVRALGPALSSVAAGYGNLRDAIAERLGLPPPSVLPGTGSMELIYLVARAFLGPEKTAHILVPTFEEYANAVAGVGAGSKMHVARESDDFHWDMESVLKSVAEEKPDLTVVCNPNNPTGVYLAPDVVHRLARAAMPGLLLIDEACLDFAENPWGTLPMLELGNVILLRSFTKTFALWPVRVGYALGPATLLEKMEESRMPESWNAHVEAVGLAALAEREHPRLVKEAVIRVKKELSTRLNEMGLRAFPTETSFILVKVPDSARMRRQLRLREIMVRDCASFGLPGFVRVATPPEPEINRVVRAFEESLK